MARRHAPPLFVRLAVLLGALGVLVGVVGLVSFGSPSLDAGPRVVLLGLPDGVVPAVEIRWRDQGVEIRQAARRQDADGAWLLPPIPAEATVTVEVRDAASGERLALTVASPPRPKVVVVGID